MFNEGTYLTIPSIYANQRYECLMAFPGVGPALFVRSQKRGLTNDLKMYYN